MAPAPSKSSTAGLRLPSGQRSPAGTTPIALFPAIARATTATARALRKHPVKTGMRPVVRPATTERRDPLRDGNISFVPAGMLKRLTGERLVVELLIVGSLIAYELLGRMQPTTKPTEARPDNQMSNPPLANVVPMVGRPAEFRDGKGPNKATVPVAGTDVPVKTLALTLSEFP